MFKYDRIFVDSLETFKKIHSPEILNSLLYGRFETVTVSLCNGNNIVGDSTDFIARGWWRWSRVEYGYLLKDLPFKILARRKDDLTKIQLATFVKGIDEPEVTGVIIDIVALKNR